MNIKDFQVTDVLADTSLVMVGSDSQLSPDHEQHEDPFLLLINYLKLDSEYVSYSGQPTEDQLVPSQVSPTRPLMSEESRQAAGALLPEPKSRLRHEESSQPDTSDTEAAVKSHFPGFPTESPPVCQITCEMEYVEKGGRRSDCSYLTGEPGYIANSRSGENTAD